MAVKYVLYWDKTGEILQSGTCPDETCLPDKPEGASFEFGLVANPDFEFIRDHRPVRRDENAGDSAIP
jgi:hypothetical protein